MAIVMVTPIEAHRVGAQEPFHSRHQVGARGFDHEMKMIAHQTPGMQLAVCLGARPAQRLQEESSIRRIAKDILPAIAAIHHVIDCARVFDPEGTRHRASMLSTSAEMCQSSGLTPDLRSRLPSFTFASWPLAKIGSRLECNCRECSQNACQCLANRRGRGDRR